MEKLIELLNEYNCNVLKRTDEWKLKNSIDHPWTKYISLSSVWAWKIYLYIISKEFWFIKWLVENNKININEEWNDYEKTNLYCNSDFFQLQKHYSYYESLLMLLSISDNPIDLLCERLK